MAAIGAGLLAVGACTGPRPAPAAAPGATSQERTTSATATPTPEAAQPRATQRKAGPRARPSASTTADWRRRLAADYERLAPRLHARAVGVRIVVVGRPDPLTLGSWRSGPAWSTIKVPLALAASDVSRVASTRDLTRRAIRTSDNAAAEGLWALLGGGPRAADAVDRRLASAGDTATRTQWRRVRASFSPYGQTQWSLDGQVAFATGLACDRSPTAALVTSEMGAVTASQRWGLGRLAGVRFKGGWGPGPRGLYLVRQVGIVPHGKGLVAVAVAVVPQNGSFAQGTAVLDAIAGWLRTALPALPAARKTC